MGTLPALRADWLLLWAKLAHSDEGFRYHPLLFHLLDTAAVAEQLWERGLSPRLRWKLAEGLGLPIDVAARWIVFLVAVHDLGKATPVFQFRLPAPKGKLEEAAARQVAQAGFPSVKLSPSACLAHSDAVSLVLPPLLRGKGLPVRLASMLADAVAGHHGRFPDETRLRLGHSAVSGDTWKHARQELFDKLAHLLQLPTQPPQQAEFAAMAILAGLTTVADWIASIASPYFPHAAMLGARPADDPENYLEVARQRARVALEELHWQLPARLPLADFRRLFPALPQPRPLQEIIAELSSTLPADEPALVIIEAPMGEGKTEAAWLLADRWGIAGSARGVYVAMPTRATSDALFARLAEVLSYRYGEAGTRSIIFQLLHGHAALSAELTMLREGSPQLQPQGLWDDAAGASAEHAATVVAGEWFTHRKRGLLAPFGVGTVDQALLAVLRVRHSFLRLFGLAGRVVVFDEVHAYDTYMATLFEQLVEWLAALGASVIVLSATLPRERRQALAAAFQRGLGRGADPCSPLPAGSYPRITVVTRETQAVHSVAPSGLAQRCLALDRFALAPDRDGFTALAQRLEHVLAEGGCAVVVCNTVRQAQECYRVLAEVFTGIADDGEPELELLHARYPFVWRQQREQRVLRRYGKPGGEVRCADGSTIPIRRPHRAVLVATQIVEQSLDLDFDLLVTLPAPIDLILQRAGRLHRHPRNTRPRLLSRPCLWLLGPAVDDEGLPIFDRGTCAVYDEFVLLQTWRVLSACSSIQLPEELDRLIEAVYGDSSPPPPPLERRWRDAQRQFEENLRYERNEARKRAVCAPYNGRLQALTDADLAEEEVALNPALQALTRLGEPAATLIPLFRWADETVTVDPDGREPVDLRIKPDRAEVIRLLRWSIPVSGARLLWELRASARFECPASWQRIPLLSSVLAAWFEPDGSLPLESGRTLRLDPVLGLVDEMGDTSDEL